MFPEQEKYQISLEKAKRYIQTADHLAYITFPLLKENRLLLKVLEELNLAVLNTINSILQYEYLYKRILIYQESRDNLATFKSLAHKYNITPEQINKLVEIISITEKHKKSPFEFVKNGKIVIMSDNMKTETINLEKIKDYLLEVKDILRKTTLCFTGRKI